MAINQEDLQASLYEILGGGPASEEGLDYARRILKRNLAEPGMEFDSLKGLREQETEVMGALRQARERLLAQKGPSRAEKLLALSAGLGAPTRTGAFGETAGNVAGQLQPIAARQTAFEKSRDIGLSELDIAEARAKGPVSQAEFDIEQLEFKQRGRETIEALKTLSRGAAAGSRGTRTREAKIKDLVDLWGYSRRDAAALVDGFVDIEVVKETGKARLINEIDKTVTVVPLGSLEGALDDMPDTYDPPAGGSTITPGEVDTRTQPEKDAGLYVDQVFRAGGSMWDMASIGSGPVPSFLAAISIPSSVVGGPIATNTLVAQQGLKLRAQTLAKQMVDNPRMPVRLIEMALEAASIEPSILETGPIMQAKMVGLDQFLYAKYLEARGYADDIGAPEELQRDGAVNARALGLFLRDLGVPIDLRRRDLFVPKDTTQDVGAVGGVGGMPELGISAPRGVPQSTWDRLNVEEKQRVIELSTELELEEF